MMTSSRHISRPLLLAACLVSLASSSAAGTLEAQQTQPSALAATQETENFRVEISAQGPYTAGATGSVKVTLTAKGVFHINDKYPYRFKAATPVDGISYPKPVLQRPDGQFQEKQAVFSLPFVASRAGTFDVGGVLHLSVCAPASCLVEKAPLNLSVVVR